MKGITLLLLRSEPMGEAAGPEGMPRLVLSASLLAFLMLLSLICVMRGRIKRRQVPPVMEDDAAGGSVTQELPVAEIQAASQRLYLLEDIVYCESREIIP